MLRTFEHVSLSLPLPPCWTPNPACELSSTCLAHHFSSLGPERTLTTLRMQPSTIFCNLPQPSLDRHLTHFRFHVVINQSPLTKKTPNFIAVRQTHTRILVCWRSWDQWCYRLLFRSTICGGTSSRLVSQSTFDQSS